MKITVIGSGYVGLVSGICFAKLGHQVACVDIDQAKIAKLKQGEIPIFEPGLKELLDECVRANKISFSVNLEEALVNSKAVFIAVGTPQDEDGSADLTYVLTAAKEIAKGSKDQKLIVTKSTVPAGSGAKIKNLVKETNPNIEFLVASNPEFLREGCAIDDFMQPDRIVIGTQDKKSEEILREIYAAFAPEKIVTCDVITAELIKYASNSFLATKISFINEMADLCEAIGGDVQKLASAMGKDERIGEKFLNVGPGFGGSCFPKDILAILNVAKNNNVDLSLIDSVVNSNKNRIEKMAKKVLHFLGAGKKIALLGLAFKGNTDDVRYSPAIAVAKKLLEKNVKILAHDFAAIANAKKEFSSANIEFCENVSDAIADVDLIVVATEWKQYCEVDFSLAKNKKILDLRNILDEEKLKNLGFEYFAIGRKN
jgi:UDPglucose 6-dehydrogenase